MEELLGNEFDDSENQFDKRRQSNDTAAISSDIEKGPVIDSMVPLYEEMEATPQKDTAATTPGLSHSEVIQKYASGTNSPSKTRMSHAEEKIEDLPLDDVNSPEILDGEQIQQTSRRTSAVSVFNNTVNTQENQAYWRNVKVPQRDQTLECIVSGLIQGARARDIDCDGPNPEKMDEVIYRYRAMVDLDNGEPDLDHLMKTIEDKYRYNSKEDVDECEVAFRSQVPTQFQRVQHPTSQYPASQCGPFPPRNCRKLPVQCQSKGEVSTFQPFECLNDAVTAVTRGSGADNHCDNDNHRLKMKVNAQISVMKQQKCEISKYRSKCQSLQDQNRCLKSTIDSMRHKNGACQQDSDGLREEVEECHRIMRQQ